MIRYATTQPDLRPVGRAAALGDRLTTGLGATVAMWGIGYFCRFPGVHTPPALIFTLLIAVLIAVGYLLAARPQHGMRDAAIAGMIAGLCNLLILGSLLGGKSGDRPAPEILKAALIWAPTCVVICAALPALGAWLRILLGGPRHAASFSPAALPTVAAAATLILLSVGGVVTGFEAGLAVPDWPNSYGYNMFLFPLSRMTGGIYFEHSHRLFGALVGLATIAVAVFVHLADDRRWVRRLALAAVAMVIVQGLLGGLRVTGNLTLSQSRHDLSPQLALAVIHGIFAQVFFSTLLALAAILSQTWRHAVPRAAPAAETDRTLSIVAPLALLTQLLFGALLRHYQWGMYVHVTFALIVLGVVGVYAIRAWSLYDGLPVIHILGQFLLILLLVQLGLGGAALIAVLSESGTAQPGPLQVLITTAHQTTGAVLLAMTANLALWQWRLTRTADVTALENRSPSASPSAGLSSGGD